MGSTKPAAKPAAPQQPSGDDSAKPQESKSDRFKRVASKRTNDALRAIDGLLNTANTANYEYSAEQAEKIVTTLTEAVDRLSKRYAGESTGKGGFSL